MRAPQRWPESSEQEWRLWRDHLDHIEDAHIGSLKREADAELARIERCSEDRWAPKRAPLVPRQQYGTRPR
jgi:hypothetical protein